MSYLVTGATGEVGSRVVEFLLEHGFLDAIVPRKEMKAYLAQALTWMATDARDTARAS